MFLWYALSVASLCLYQALLSEIGAIKSAVGMLTDIPAGEPGRAPTPTSYAIVPVRPAPTQPGAYVATPTRNYSAPPRPSSVVDWSQSQSQSMDSFDDDEFDGVEEQSSFAAQIDDLLGHRHQDYQFHLCVRVYDCVFGLAAFVYWHLPYVGLSTCRDEMHIDCEVLRVCVRV